MSIAWIDRMAVDVRGDGDAVLAIHGLGGSMNAWTPLLPGLRRLRVVRPELPGAGRSSRAHALAETSPTRGKLSVATHVEAVLRVMQVLGIERAHVLGHSFGSIIALHLASREPAKVRSLALFGTLAEAYPAMRDNMKARATVAREQGMFDIAEAISDVALSASSRETLPVVVAYVRESVAAQDAEGFARNCIALAESTTAPLEQVRCPVLVVNGDEDVVTPLSGARQVAERLPQARLEVLSRCGHWPMQERTAECARLLGDFLARVR